MAKIWGKSIKEIELLLDEKDKKIKELEQMLDSRVEWHIKGQKERIITLEERHKKDCEEIERLNTALEVITQKYAKLRG